MTVHTRQRVVMSHASGTIGRVRTCISYEEPTEDSITLGATIYHKTEAERRFKLPIIARAAIRTTFDPETHELRHSDIDLMAGMFGSISNTRFAIGVLLSLAGELGNRYTAPSIVSDEISDRCRIDLVRRVDQSPVFSGLLTEYGCSREDAQKAEVHMPYPWDVDRLRQKLNDKLAPHEYAWQLDTIGNMPRFAGYLLMDLDGAAMIADEVTSLPGSLQR